MEGTPDILDYVEREGSIAKALRNKVCFEARLPYALPSSQVGSLSGKLRALPRY